MNTWKCYCKELSRNGNTVQVWFYQAVVMCSLGWKKNVGQFLAFVDVTLVVVYGNTPYGGFGAFSGLVSCEALTLDHIVVADLVVLGSGKIIHVMSLFLSLGCIYVCSFYFRQV